jgi:hypothetical protein
MVFVALQCGGDTILFSIPERHRPSLLVGSFVTYRQLFHATRMPVLELETREVNATIDPPGIGVSIAG